MIDRSEKDDPPKIFLEIRIDKGVVRWKMNKEEIQEIKMTYIQEERRKIESQKEEIRKLIDGALNRISITENEAERDQLPEAINYQIIEYKRLSKISYDLFKEIIRDLGIE